MNTRTPVSTMTRPMKDIQRACNSAFETLELADRLDHKPQVKHALMLVCYTLGELQFRAKGEARKLYRTAWQDVQDGFYFQAWRTFDQARAV